MSLRSVERDDLRELRPCRKDDLAIRSDEGGGRTPVDGKSRMRTQPPGPFAADAHREVRALLDVFGPGAGLHREPLGGNVVEHEEEHAARGEDRQKADGLLLDEPTSALDVSVQAEILNLLTRLRGDHGLTMLMVSHDLAVIAHICDHIGVMHSGRLLEMTTAAALAEGRVSNPHSQQLLRANQGFDASGGIVDVAA